MVPQALWYDVFTYYFNQTSLQFVFSFDNNNESIKMTRSISNDNGVTNITINKEMEPNHNNVKSSNTSYYKFMV
jgi:hypothetical protein